jgi:hypothetical protein
VVLKYLISHQLTLYKANFIQKIKELEDKVDDLKSAAKRRKIFCATVNEETKEVLAPEMKYGPDICQKISFILIFLTVNLIYRT